MHSFIRSLALIFILIGCKSYKAKYPYSLSDFNPELRVHLERVIQNGGMCNEEPFYSGESISTNQSEYFPENISSADLRKLIDCEHPILRVLGFSYLKAKKDSDIPRILLNHLDDNAVITVCNGEFGPGYTTVSDAFISSVRRDSVILKSVLIDAVLTKHFYLNHAYQFINEIEKPDAKYYSVIKKMAITTGFALDQNDLYAKKEISLYALSKYKRKEDIAYIANELFLHSRLFSGYYNYGFKLIAENPDTAYFKIIEHYYRGIAANNSRQNLQYAFANSVYKIGEKYDSFLSALVAFKNKRSSQMIDTIIKRKLYPDDFYSPYNGIHSDNYPCTIYYLLKENECPEYKKLIKLLNPAALAYTKEREKKDASDLKSEPLPAYTLYNESDDPYW